MRDAPDDKDQPEHYDVTAPSILSAFFSGERCSGWHGTNLHGKWLCKIGSYLKLVQSLHVRYDPKLQRAVGWNESRLFCEIKETGSYNVRKFIWWRYCLALCEEIFDRFPLFYLTKLYVTLSFATVSSVKFSEVRLNFSKSVHLQYVR